MNIKSLTKTTLTDYPGLVASTIYIGGCQFRCPYCCNGSLINKNLPDIPLEEVYDFLSRRKDSTDGVCITGGEPTMQPDLCDFLYDIKTMGYKIRLETNGYDPVILSKIIHHHLADYIAMDIKHTPEKYKKAAAIQDFDIARIRLSVDFLKDCKDIDYEFRTTITRELHELSDIHAIGAWIKGARRYALCAYTETPDTLMPIFSNYTQRELLPLKHNLLQMVKNIELRGF